jgi:hypothetical protein
MYPNDLANQINLLLGVAQIFNSQMIGRLFQQIKLKEMLVWAHLHSLQLVIALNHHG